MRIRADDRTRSELWQQLMALRELGVKKVDVVYCGSGDSGYIEGVEFTPKLKEEFNRESFDETLYNFLNPANIGDWVNNEGGFGEISIDLETGKIEGKVCLNTGSYTTTKLKDNL